MFEFLAAVLAIAAFIFSRKALSRNTALEERIALLEAQLGGALRSAPAAPTAEVPPAVAPTPEPVTAEAAPAETSEAPPAPPTVEVPPVAPERPGFEERLGTRWVVWLGGLTLALGGLFLVRYSIEAGLIGPKARVVLGWLFAAVLLAAGEWTRRKESVSTIAALPIANIPAVLTAAGTAVAFGVTYAAYALYDLIPPAIAFLLLGAVALATLAAALLHGPALAGLGVIGAFVTPLLVSSEKPDFWALYIYLAVVTAASLGLARARLWRWLAVTTVVLGVVWALPDIQNPALIAPHSFHVIAGFALAAALVVAGLLFGPQAEPGRIEPVSSGVLIAWLFATVLLTVSHMEQGAVLAVFTLLTAATLAIGWRSEAATAAVPAAGLFTALVFANWFVQTSPDFTMVPSGVLPGLAPRPTDEATTRHLLFGIGFAVAFGASGFLAQGRSRSALIATLWSATGTVTPLLILIALYARIAHLDRSMPFAIAALALAGVFAFAVEKLVQRDPQPGQQTSLAIYATASLGALALALTMALEKGWLTVALALMAPAAAWVSTQRPIPFLRWLAGLLAAVVAARFAWDPRIAGSDVGTTPILNWLLWGYGVPAASFAYAGWMMRRQADDVPTRMAEAAAILFTTLLVFLQIRHLMTGGDIFVPSEGLAEPALQVCAAIAMAIGLERLCARSGSVVHNFGAIALTGLAAYGTLFGLLAFENPMLTGSNVGGPFFNLLLLAYALPAVLALILARSVSGSRPAPYANTIAGAALLLALVYVTLQIRRIYHGPVLTLGATTDAEQYTYSVAWLAFGVVLLLGGWLFDSRRARLASAVVIGLTVMKAFFIDMSGLTGVLRALSFIGLGLVLVAIGWLYQRILFPRRVAQS